jgi:uncharacterized protein (DUF2336 family)
MPEIVETDRSSLIDELEEAISSGSLERRKEMLERVSNLFMAGSRHYSDEQLVLFDDVLVQLTAEIELEARTKLSELVADTDRAIPNTIRLLAFDDAIEVAAPVLSRSPQLTDDDLVENASTKGQGHLLAISQRLRLSELVTDVLVERGDRRVRRSVAGNPGASFSLAGYEKLATHGRSDRALALAMLHRTDIPRQFFVKLIENASASVRAKFEAAMPAAPAAIAAAVNEVASSLSDDAREVSIRHSKAIRDGKQRRRAHASTEVNVHAPAAAQRFDRTVEALARLGRFSYYLVERALLDQGADMVIILARAAGCSWITTKALLRMYASGRRLSERDLAEAYAKYERLSPGNARLIVNFHERRAKLHDGAHGLHANLVSGERTKVA